MSNCACGCGLPVSRSNQRGGQARAVTRRYRHGHNRRGAIPVDVAAAVRIVRTHPDWRQALVDELNAELDHSSCESRVIRAAQRYAEASAAFRVAGGILALEGDALVEATGELLQAVAALNETAATPTSQGPTDG